jgi:hypothetical protein
LKPDYFPGGVFHPYFVNNSLIRAINFIKDNYLRLKYNCSYVFPFVTKKPISMPGSLLKRLLPSCQVFAFLGTPEVRLTTGKHEQQFVEILYCENTHPLLPLKNIVN